MTVFNDITQLLQKPGTIGVIPTDTVYGVVACANDKAAVERLYKLKHREGKPGTIVAASVEQLEQLGLKHRYLKAVEQYWPASLSVIIPCGFDLAWLHQGKMSLAVRVPQWQPLHDLLLQTGPLLTSSANHPGEPTAVTIEQAQNYFQDGVDFYIDGGDLSSNQPSTIIRVIDDAIDIVRQGAVQLPEA